MTASLFHRGPDADGFFVAPGIGLGHRRLSIIDLSGGAQPLSNEDGRIWVVFNGEIFNYIELRADLMARGHIFRTKSDTEVLVHLYEEYGLGFLDRLNGQFALAIWDSQNERLVLARDRVGIRPLFLTTLPDGTVLFASEIKAFLAHGGFKAELDPIALGQISTFWVCVPPRTPFKGVEELGAGEVLVFDSGQRRKIRYWKPEFPNEDEYEERTPQYWQQETRSLLEDAVRLQLRSDVPVATYLSGGLDSSILTALVKGYQDDQVTSFSVGFSDAHFDERTYSRQMVSHLNTRHREVEVQGSDIGQSFGDVVWYAERPMMRTAPAPLMRLSRLVRESGIKVVLTGEGADEVFGGYNIFREDKIRRFWARNPQSAWRPALLSRLYPYIERDAKAESFWRSFFRPGLESVDNPNYSHLRRWSNGAQLRRVFSPELRAQMQTESEMLEELEAALDPSRVHWHPLCRAQYLEMTMFMSCYLLNSQGDRMMMANSVEGRVPFLDHRVIELGARIPPKLKIRGLTEKYLLKKAFDDLLPKSIAWRPKQPYRAPITSSLLDDRDSLVSRLLQRSEIDRTGLVHPQALEVIVKRCRDGKHSERDEMSLAVAGSVQLLNHLFVENFDASKNGYKDHERTTSAH